MLLAAPLLLSCTAVPSLSTCRRPGPAAPLGGVVMLAAQAGQQASPQPTATVQADQSAPKTGSSDIDKAAEKVATPAPAQQLRDRVEGVDTPLFDPDAPMAEMPDLGVAWPDLKARDPGLSPSDDMRPRLAAQSRYSFKVEGTDDVADDLFMKRFDALSALKAHDGEEANAAQIDRRAREDAALLTTLMRGLGYYDVRVVTSVEPVNGVLQVTLAVMPGDRYTFAQVDLSGIKTAGPEADALAQSFGVAEQSPVDADTIVAGEDALKTKLGESGFPFAKVGQSEIVIDHESKKATLTLDVDPGGARMFGRITTVDTRIFNAKHIQDIARFRPGDPFDQTQLEDLRRALIQTGLISSVDLKPVPGNSPDTVDIAVKMERAPPRTIAGELGYGTGEGVRAEVSWTHRNLFPPEGAFTVRGVAGTQEQSGGITFRRNNFEGRDRVLTAQLIGSNIQRSAYRATSVSLSGSLERQTTIFFQKAWTWSLGAELTASDERDVNAVTGLPRQRTFFIGALPTSLNYDGTDDLLNPTKGFRLGGRVSPELSLQGNAFGYVRVQLDASAYKSITDKFVLAGRLRLGTIAGASRDAIAPSRRFYAGGGGSVRGYGYQAIGPRDPNNDPIGGRSLTEFSVEGRVRAFGNFGLVPFFDAGNIYTSPLPSFKRLQYGAGLGFRYYSSFGPIRLDIGTPLNPQRGDPRVAFYVSLGQAF